LGVNDWSPLLPVIVIVVAFDVPPVDGLVGGVVLPPYPPEPPQLTQNIDSKDAHKI